MHRKRADALDQGRAVFRLRRGGISQGGQLFVAGNDHVHSLMYVEVTRDRLAFWSVGEDGRVLDAGTLNPPPASLEK